MRGMKLKNAMLFVHGKWSMMIVLRVNCTMNLDRQFLMKRVLHRAAFMQNGNYLANGHSKEYLS